MNINTTLGIMTAVTFAFPIIVMIFARLFINISLIALSLYFLMALASNLALNNIIELSSLAKTQLYSLNNYFDVPLVLTSMLLFSGEKKTQKLILLCLVLFMLFELILFFKFQLNAQSSKYVMGPGIILIFALSVYFFINNIKKTIMLGKGIGKTLMIASILFAYGCYLLVFIFTHLAGTTNMEDVFIIYNFSSIIFSIIISLGLIMVKKRLVELKEVETTRKELAAFFNHSH